MEIDKEKIQRHIQKLHEANSAPGIISGIHNYCDRWCERCTHTNQCAVYKMDPRTVEEISDVDNKEFWENLSLNMAAMKEMLYQMMEEHGIDPNELSEYEEEEHIETTAERLTKEYSTEVSNWLKKNNETFRALMLQKAEENEAMVLAIDDAVEVLHWYAHFIYVKTHRAMQTENNLWGEDEEFDLRFYDNLGSAKISLLSIKRSMEALSFLLKYMPEQEADILHLLVLLEKSHRLIEQRWPTAMEFKRPGLD